MPDFRVSSAALVEAYRSGQRLNGLPEQPRSADDCFLIQDLVTQALGSHVAGWKAGMPEDKEPYRAPIYQHDIYSSPAAISRAGRARFGVEAEVAFRFARSLPPRSAPYDRADVIAAVGSAHAAIELVETRYAVPVPYLCRLADNQSQGGFVFGPAVTDWCNLDIAHLPIVMFIDGIEVGRAVGGNPSGDPIRPTVWLANHLRKRGTGIWTGAFVTTGSTTGLAVAKPNSHVRVEFEGLGRVDATFVE